MAADTSGDRPDLEAALLSEHWQPVLCYADLCTISAEEAVRLASEAFARTLREAPPWSAPHFSWLPRLLIGVRNTAADWQAEGSAHLLAPGLRVWLQAEEGPSTALHSFQDMPEPDKSLLWHSEIESRPPAESAAALRCAGRGTADRGLDVAWTEISTGQWCRVAGLCAHPVDDQLQVAAPQVRISGVLGDAGDHDLDYREVPVLHVFA